MTAAASNVPAVIVPFRWTKPAESLAKAMVLKPPKFDQPFWNVGWPAAPTSCHASIGASPGFG